MIKIKIFFLSLFTLILSGCQSTSTEPISIEKDELIRLSGAVNRSYYNLESDYNCQAVIKSWEIGNTFFISLKVRNLHEDKSEQVSLNFYVPLGNDDFPDIGKYYTYDLSDNFSGVFFKSYWNNNSSQYRFESSVVRLLIENNMNGRVTGKFSITARQSYGQRIFDGQVEDIKLANQGKITVNGIIDVEVDL